MPEMQYNSLNEFLSEFPKQDIIDTINTIDEKIGSMHTISSKDFLFFNQLLKDYYKHIRGISEGNNQLNTIVNQDLPLIVNNLKENYIQQKKDLESVVFFSQDLIEKLTITLSVFDLIVVPFNNFKQNLITLKYILANLRLHLSYLELQNKSELLTSVQLLENTLIEVQVIIDQANAKIDKVISEIIDLKNIECLVETANDPQIPEYIDHINKELHRLDISLFFPDVLFNNLNKYTQICFSNLGEVITNIQYHDIIRQKMEHIQASHKELLVGLNGINSSDVELNSIEEQLNFIVKIPEVTDIQVAQLLYTNRDYQSSIEKITTMLIDVGREMKLLHGVFDKMNEGAGSINEKVIFDLDSKYEIFTGLKHKNKECVKSTVDKIKLTNQNYNELKNLFNQIFLMEKSIRTQIRQFEFKVTKNGKNFGIELVKRLMHLISDLQINSNSLKSNLNIITQQFLMLDQLSHRVSKQSGKEEAVDISVESLRNKIADIGLIAKEFSTLSIKISDEITQSLKKIEYYGYFKATVEEIVVLLNKINKAIDYQSIKDLANSNNELLNKIEKLYTMKSERDIHAKYTQAPGMEEDKNGTQSDMDENDIELF
jgi:hypothetical protein